MKKLLIGLIGITASYTCFAEQITTNATPSVNSNNPFYVGAGLATGGFNNAYQIKNQGKVTTGNKNNGVLATDLHLGWKDKAVRAEVSLGYIDTQRAYSEYDSYVKENVLKTTTSGALATMIDGYYDVQLGQQFTAYVGVGAGLLHTFSSGTTTSKQSKQTAAANNFAYNAKLGIDFDLSSTVQAYAGGEILRLTGNNPYMNDKDYFTTVSAGINYSL